VSTGNAAKGFADGWMLGIQGGDWQCHGHAQ
jgi:hypothetical protein